METKAQKQLIFEKIPAIMTQVSVIEKTRKNPQQGYSFRGIDDMYNELHGLFASNKVFFTSRVLHAEREERINKSGSTLVYTILDIEFTFYAEDGSNISSVMRGEAMDSGDKASSKATSAALKYALMQMFMIPTLEEKDTEYQSHEVTPREPKIIAPVLEERQSDIRPWLTEVQFKAMLEAIEEGKAGVVMAKIESYKIRRDYREKLNASIASAQTIAA